MPQREEAKKIDDDIITRSDAGLAFFPFIGAVNPALSAMAYALRVGDHLLERLK